MTADHPPTPAFGERSLAELMPAVLHGMAVATEDPVRFDLPPWNRVCLLLVDGLGMAALRAHAEHAPFLTSLLEHPASRELTSVFPTTTPIALTSLGTGLPPGQHGIVGLLIRRQDGRVVNTLAIPAEMDLAAFQPRPTAFERAAQAGVAVTRVGPAAFERDGLTAAGLRGGDYAVANTVGERVAAATAAVRREGRSLTYLYHGDLDATGHRKGAASPAWRQELAHVDRFVEQLAAALPAGAVLLVTSDHGMVDVPFEHRTEVSTHPALRDGVAAMTGDPRGAHVHALPGAAADVEAAWREVLGGDFWVLTRDEAEWVGLFGSVADHVRPLLGDLVLAARADHAVIDSRVLPPAVKGLVGQHGSVTSDELLVPLLVHES